MVFCLWHPYVEHCSKKHMNRPLYTGPLLNPISVRAHGPCILILYQRLCTAREQKEIKGTPQGGLGNNARPGACTGQIVHVIVWNWTGLPSINDADRFNSTRLSAISLSITWGPLRVLRTRAPRIISANHFIFKSKYEYVEISIGRALHFLGELLRWRKGR